MREIKDCTERLLTLVGLLSEMGRLEICASISPIDAKPGSDEAKLRVHFSGRDTPLLTADNGRVLEAIEILAAEILELADFERHALQFDAGEFLADQEFKLRQVARTAIGRVRYSGTPHVFPPMCFRDRRLLEQELVISGLYFETLGQQAARWVVLFPGNVPASLDVPAMHYSSGN